MYYRLHLWMNICGDYHYEHFVSASKDKIISYLEKELSCPVIAFDGGYINLSIIQDQKVLQTLDLSPYIQLRIPHFESKYLLYPQTLTLNFKSGSGVELGPELACNKNPEKHPYELYNEIYPIDSKGPKKNFTFEVLIDFRKIPLLSSPFDIINNRYIDLLIYEYYVNPEIPYWIGDSFCISYEKTFIISGSERYD